MSYKKVTDTYMEALCVLFIDYSYYLCSTNAKAILLIGIDLDNNQYISGTHHCTTNNDYHITHN